MHKLGAVLFKSLAKERGLAMCNRQEDARRARRLARISRPSDRLSINSEKLFLFMLICLRNLFHRGTPPQPGIIAPASGWSERCICNAAYSSSLMASTIRFVKTLVSRKIMCVLCAIGVSLSRGRRLPHNDERRHKLTRRAKTVSPTPLDIFRFSRKAEDRSSSRSWSFEDSFMRNRL